MMSNRSRASPGSRGVASLLSSTWLESASMGRRIRWCRSIPWISMPHLKRTRRIMLDSTILQRNARPIRYEAATHLFTTGQIVRLKGGFGLQSQSADTYRITATLPPRGDSQQYRIRNDGEHYERVATQDSLEAVRISPAGPRGALFEGPFGAGKSNRSTATARSEKPKSEKAGSQPEGPRNWMKGLQYVRRQ